ncbi:MAG: DivIVA domain-containing protein [Bacillota bacterium]|nr:DivIVA domain-containing protein [Bacillota bacterium]
MVLTPLEVYNKEFKKSLRGYNEEEVDSFIDKILADYEKLYKENIDMKEALGKSHANLEQYKKIEETLHNSIIIAQQTAEEVKKTAEERAELLNKQAEERAKEIISDAETKVHLVQQEYIDLIKKTRLFKIKLKSFLQSQLDIIDDDIANSSGEEIELE